MTRQLHQYGSSTEHMYVAFVYTLISLPSLDPARGGMSNASHPYRSRAFSSFTSASWTVEKNVQTLSWFIFGSSRSPLLLASTTVALSLVELPWSDMNCWENPRITLPTIIHIDQLEAMYFQLWTFQPDRFNYVNTRRSLLSAVPAACLRILYLTISRELPYTDSRCQF